MISSGSQVNRYLGMRIGMALVMLFLVHSLLSAQTDRSGNVQLTTLQGKPYAAVIDIFPQLCLGRYTPEKVEKNIALLADLGIKRLYCVVCLPGYPSFSNPWLSLMSPDNDCENYSLKSLVALESPNFEFCRLAKKHGMEVIAVLKPYEGGGGATIPEGGKFFWEAGGRHACVGGERVCFDSFLASHPEFRVQRKPIPDHDALAKQAFQGLELVFCLDEIPSTNGRPVMPAAKLNYQIEEHPVVFRLWAGPDNGEFKLVEKPYRLREYLDERILRDVNGKPLSSEKKRCRIVEISGLDLSQEVGYLGVSLHGDAGDIHRLQTIPGSMFRAFGTEAEIPVTTAQYVRHGVSPSQVAVPPKDRLWGMEKHPRQGSMDFTEWGFEFDWYGGGIWFGEGWHNQPVYGIGRGKIMTMKGTHCEAYPEVRDYWLDQVETLIDMGYDGVDIRLQNHSGMVSDIANFGFNPPLVERYRDKYGKDPLGDDFDPMEMMSVRGEFFQLFLEDAAELLHKHGRILQVHLRHAHQDPLMSADFNQLGFWAMPKVWLEDWKSVVDLADEVTLKDYFWGNYDPGQAREIKEYARTQGKEVWVHNYIGQGDGISDDFIGPIDRDTSVTGILLYEAFHSGKGSNEPNQGLITVDGDEVSYHEPAIKALKRVSRLAEWDGSSFQPDINNTDDEH